MLKNDRKSQKRSNKRIIVILIKIKFIIKNLYAKNIKIVCICVIFKYHEIRKAFPKKRKKVDDCDEMFTKERCKYFCLTLISFLL